MPRTGPGRHWAWQGWQLHSTAPILLLLSASGFPPTFSDLLPVPASRALPHAPQSHPPTFVLLLSSHRAHAARVGPRQPAAPQNTPTPQWAQKDVQSRCVPGCARFPWTRLQSHPVLGCHSSDSTEVSVSSWSLNTLVLALPQSPEATTCSGGTDLPSPTFNGCKAAVSQGHPRSVQDFARASPEAPTPGQRRNISLRSNLPGRAQGQRLLSD